MRKIHQKKIKKNCRINLTIHLRPGVVEKPVCLLTKDVCLVNLNLEGSTAPKKEKKRKKLKSYPNS